jgi:hypothetical protein
MYAELEYLSVASRGLELALKHTANVVNGECWFPVCGVRQEVSWFSGVPVASMRNGMMTLMG